MKAKIIRGYVLVTRSNGTPRELITSTEAGTAHEVVVYPLRTDAEAEQQSGAAERSEYRVRPCVLVVT